jgi:hypothetical protein
MANAEESYVCWTEDRLVNGRPNQVLTCRIGGSRVERFPDGDPPVILFPAVGYDAVGECWYDRTEWTGWIIVAQFADGSALMQYDPDLIPGGPVVADARIRRCESEPDDTPPPVVRAWEVIQSFTFDRPDPVFTPDVGVTGLDTFVAAAPPEPVTVTLASPGTGGTLTVEFHVVQVTIDWGDGATQEVPASLFAELAPFPDGTIAHVYETSAHTAIDVAFEWLVRWRVGTGAWNVVDITPTTATTDYQVDQIAGRISG